MCILLEYVPNIIRGSPLALDMAKGCALPALGRDHCESGCDASLSIVGATGGGSGPGREVAMG